MVEKRFLAPGRLPVFCLSAFVALWCVVVAIYSLTRFYTLKTSLFDLGAFDQVLWLLAQGKAPLTHIIPSAPGLHWLGFHFSPILYALVPFYWLWPYPETLLTLQPFFFALTSWPIYRIARIKDMPPAVSAAMAGVVLLHPFTLNAALFDFHEIALATPILAFALLSFTQKRFGVLCLWLILLMLCKEHYGATVAGFGLLWGILYGEWRKALLLTAAGLAGLVLVIFIFMPALGGQEQHLMFTGGMDVLKRYSWLHLPLDEAVRHLLSLLTGWHARFYVLVMFVIVLFLPLMAPWLLLPAAADLLGNLLSDAIMPRSPLAYHSAAMVPVLLFAVIYVSARWMDNAKVRRALYAIPIFAAIGTYIAGPFLLPHSMASWQLGAPVLRPPDAIREIKEVLPADASLAAQSNIGAFFSQRENIRSFINGDELTDAVALYLESPFSPSSFQLYNVPFGQSLERYGKAVKRMLDRRDYGIVYWERPWLLLKRGEKDRFPRSEARKALQELLVNPDPPARR